MKETNEFRILSKRWKKNWEKEIKKCLETGKYQGKTAVAEAGYDIMQEAKLLEKFYLSLEDEK